MTGPAPRRDARASPPTPRRHHHLTDAEEQWIRANAPRLTATELCRGIETAFGRKIGWNSMHRQCARLGITPASRHRTPAPDRAAGATPEGTADTARGERDRAAGTNDAAPQTKPRDGGEAGRWWELVKALAAERGVPITGTGDDEPVRETEDATP